jgi:hypothetical protein
LYRSIKRVDSIRLIGLITGNHPIHVSVGIAMGIGIAYSAIIEILKIIKF